MRQGFVVRISKAPTSQAGEGVTIMIDTRNRCAGAGASPAALQGLINEADQIKLLY